MTNLVLITSVVNTPNKPLSYTTIRSLYTREERFEATKKTIESVKLLIPDCKIIIVECSDLRDYELDFFNNNCDYVLNLWDKKELHDNIFGLSKSLGEGTQTIMALTYINNNNIKYDNLFKITGRYYLNNNFKYDNFNNTKIVCKMIEGNKDNIVTSLYKLPYTKVKDFHDFLINNIDKMKICVGYELLFGLFISKYDNIQFYNTIGVSGRVCCDYNESNW